MANTKSAAKAARQSLKRKAVNDARRSRMKTTVKASEAAIAAGDKAVAVDAFKTMQGELMRSARNVVCLTLFSAGAPIERIARLYGR